jgi:hypothetical protein
MPQSRLRSPATEGYQLVRGYASASRSAVFAAAGGRGGVDDALQRIASARDNVLSSSLPSEADIKQVLAQAEAAADALVGPVGASVELKDDSAAKALLSVDEPPSSRPAPKAAPPKHTPQVQRQIDRLSEILHSMLLHPTVFISPEILRHYVSLQSRLRKPETFPQIFDLYSSKPVPEEGTTPVRFKEQNPNKAANAVPLEVATQGLQAAIDSKQLETAMRIIESTFARKAFQHAKFIKKGLLPTTGLAAAPVAAYALAGQFANYQTTMDPAMATNMAFAGIVAYIGFTATIGIVAVTTANDQMERVTWATGMPLRERWLREEERAAIDRIAVAWGFKEKWRRGDEEGPEWDALREWVGRKGMVLDAVALMEGME